MSFKKLDLRLRLAAELLALGGLHVPESLKSVPKGLQDPPLVSIRGELLICGKNFDKDVVQLAF